MDTEKIAEMHNDARKAAEGWVEKGFKPVTYSVPFSVKGTWVRVTIELDSTQGGTLRSRRRADDRLSVEELYPDRSIDA